MSETTVAKTAGDQKMELVMGRLLQFGVLLSSLCVLVGGTLYLRTHAGIVVSYRVFASEPEELRDLRGLARSLAAGRPEAIIQLGVLLLIATPIARVVFAAFSFAMERDRLYLAISLLILGVLVVGLLHAT